jgi:hypothetical protein
MRGAGVYEARWQRRAQQRPAVARYEVVRVHVRRRERRERLGAAHDRARPASSRSSARARVCVHIRAGPDGGREARDRGVELLLQPAAKAERVIAQIIAAAT